MKVLRYYAQLSLVGIPLGIIIFGTLGLGDEFIQFIILNGLLGILIIAIDYKINNNN